MTNTNTMTSIKFGMLAYVETIEVSTGTNVPDYRTVYYFPETGEVYNEGYRSCGIWVDSWWD